MKRRNTEDIVLSSDDESTKDQRDEKSLKTKEEPVDSQEVIELKQKVAKLEKDFQGSCRYAREFELRMEEAQNRVEFLEELIDKKPLAANATDNKLAEELQKKIDELTSKLAQADSVQEELVEEQRKVCSLTKELDKERSQAKEERRRLHDKIDDLRDHRDELARKLDDSEKKLKEEQQNKGEDDRRRNVDLQSENGYSIVPNFTVFPTEPKKEAIDMSQVIPDDNHTDEVNDMNSNQIEKEEETEEKADKLKDSSENIEVEQLRKSSRTVVKRNSQRDVGPSEKKTRSDSKKKIDLGKKSNKAESRSKSQNALIIHKNYAELECPECEFSTTSVMGWEKHLCKFHSTTPVKAGLILRCECGDESFSSLHSRICKISKIFVIRKEDATTKKPQILNHKELECPECEHRTMSVTGWVQHLRTSHATTPTQAGLALRCECGNESISFRHSRICNISKMTVVRKKDETTKKSQAS